ncbi:hypothetical protein HNR46_000810 [Haloferula luteola]|uniref:Uncharacterized protein n=1 Tax=Haloferula luteola TaxID=595692 RepID=A0A840UXS5_9BACT|nr:hypothetical protein [Haloferula luteola]
MALAMARSGRDEEMKTLIACPRLVATEIYRNTTESGFVLLMVLVGRPAMSRRRFFGDYWIGL